MRAPPEPARQNPLQRAAWSTVQVGATLGLLVWAYARVDPTHLRSADLAPGWLALALLCTAPAYLAAALRWSYTAQRLGVPLPFRRALPEVYLASFLNSLLPTGLAGDVLRAARHAALTADRALYPRVWLSVALERFSGQLVLWLLLPVSLSRWPLHDRGFVWWPLLLGLLVFVAAVFWPSTDLWRSLRRALFTEGALGVQLVTSSVVLACCILGFACSAKGLSVPLSFSDLLRIVPLVLALSALPLSIGGFGVREAASAALYAGSGLDGETGILVASTYGLLNLLGSAPGALFVWLRGGARDGR